MLRSRRLLPTLAIVALALLGSLAAGASAAGASAAERTVFGHSVQGRPLTVTALGPADAPLRVLVVGCIHGDETAGITVVRRLLAAGAPRNVRLYLVPTLNPDGVVANSRGNAHGVDLNRNFPYRWAPLGGGEYSGPGPLSEPESRAATKLIRATRPTITIWFHQPFGIVDLSGGDEAIERRYAALSGLPAVRLSRYPGSVSRWQNHSFAATTAFVAELPRFVSAALSRRAAAAVRALAAEYASPELGSVVPAG